MDDKGNRTDSGGLSMTDEAPKKNPWVAPPRGILKEWTLERVGKLSIWVTVYLAYYFFMITSFPDLRVEWWWGYLSAGIALLMATLTLRVLFRVIGVSQMLIDLIDWATEPHK